MKVDTKKLISDAKRLHVQQADKHSAGRTGATDIITMVLPTIRQLREEGCTWAVIAASLAAQGVVQGAERRPLQGRRLCALLAAIDKRDERRASKRRARHTRRDLMPKDISHLSIAPELTGDTVGRRSDISESALRAEALANLQPLLKGRRR